MVLWVYSIDQISQERGITAMYYIEQLTTKLSTYLICCERSLPGMTNSATETL